MKKHLGKQMFVCGHNQHDISEPVQSYGIRKRLSIIESISKTGLTEH